MIKFQEKNITNGEEGGKGHLAVNHTLSTFCYLSNLITNDSYLNSNLSLIGVHQFFS